jgi:alkylation response protein AidB-like acyl-CoA dehydrogenase
LRDVAEPDVRRVPDDTLVPVGTLRRVPGDLLAVANGALWCLWNATAAHAESRPMFRRVLADFPVIRYRLLRALVAVLEAEEHAERAAADPDDGGSRAAFRAACSQVRTETQQLCGGSGFMCESDYAVTLMALDECLRLLGLLPSAALVSRDRAQCRVRARLEAWGVTAAEWAALAPFASRPHRAN